MRLWMLVFVVAWWSSGATASPTSTPSTRAASSDGAEYGAADSSPVPVVRLPGLPLALGVEPGAAVGARRVLSREKSGEKVAALLAPFDSLWPERWRRSSQFLMQGGQDLVGFDVDAGRITRFIVYYRSMRAERLRGIAEAARRAVAKASPAVIVEYDPPASDGGVAALCAFFNPIDFRLLVDHDMSPQIREALRAKKLAVGETEAQARAALWELNARVEAEDATSKTIIWERHEAIIGGPLQLPKGWRDVPCFGASLEHGRVTEVDDFAGH